MAFTFFIAILIKGLNFASLLHGFGRQKPKGNFKGTGLSIKLN